MGSLDVAGQDLALADVIGAADDAFGLHPLDDAGGPVIADLEVALHEARRGLAITADQRDRLVVERVAGIAAVAAGIDVERCLDVLGDLVEIDRLAVALEEGDDVLDLLVADERPVDAGDAAAAGHVEHVAAAEQLLGAALAED